MVMADLGWAALPDIRAFDQWLDLSVEKLRRNGEKTGVHEKTSFVGGFILSDFITFDNSA
jgi:hypothetical protein